MVVMHGGVSTDAPLTRTLEAYATDGSKNFTIPLTFLYRRSDFPSPFTSPHPARLDARLATPLQGHRLVPNFRNEPGESAARIAQGTSLASAARHGISG